MSDAFSEDELLGGLDSSPQPPVAPTSGPSRPGSVRAWVIVIPKPRLALPSLRTALEVLAVLVLICWLGSAYLPSAVPIAHHETGPLIAELVEDTERDGKATGPLKSDATLKPKLAELDCQWGWLESSDPMAGAILKGQAAPVVAIVRKGETDPLKVLPVPADGDLVVAAVKALRGKD